MENYDICSYVNYLEWEVNNLSFENQKIYSSIIKAYPINLNYAILPYQNTLYCQFQKGGGYINYPFANFKIIKCTKIAPFLQHEYPEYIVVKCIQNNEEKELAIKYDELSDNTVYKAFSSNGLNILKIRSNNLKFSKELFFNYFLEFLSPNNIETKLEPCIPGWFKNDNNLIFATKETFPNSLYPPILEFELKKVINQPPVSNCLMQIIPLFAAFENNFSFLLLIFFRELQIVYPLFKKDLKINKILNIIFDKTVPIDQIKEFLTIFTNQSNSSEDISGNSDNVFKKIKTHCGLFFIDIDSISKNVLLSKLEMLKNVFCKHIVYDKTNKDSINSICCCISNKKFTEFYGSFITLFLGSDDVDISKLYAFKNEIQYLSVLDEEVIHFCSNYFDELQTIIFDNQKKVAEKINRGSYEIDTINIVAALYTIFETICRVYSIYNLNFKDLLPFKDEMLLTKLLQFIADACESIDEKNVQEIFVNQFLNSNKNSEIITIVNSPVNTKCIKDDSIQNICYADNYYVYIPQELFNNIIFPRMNLGLISKTQLLSELSNIMESHEGFLYRKVIYVPGQKEVRMRCYTFKRAVFDQIVGEELDVKDWSNIKCAH